MYRDHTDSQLNDSILKVISLFRGYNSDTYTDNDDDGEQLSQVKEITNKINLGGSSSFDSANTDTVGGFFEEHGLFGGYSDSPMSTTNNVLKQQVSQFEDVNPDQNNGMITKIWGPALWTSLHTISFGYPVNPTNEHKTFYKNFFRSLKDVLPCKYCRDSYETFITTGNTAITDEVMKSRATLTKWLYLVHEAVNSKLGVNYGVSYEDVVKRYESYRAKCDKTKKEPGCIMPLSQKACSYKVAAVKDCPVISAELAKQFVYYGELRGVPKEDMHYISSSNIKDMVSNKESLEWTTRNKECTEIIASMRANSVPSLETEGKWIGMPTIDELKLILRLSSNIDSQGLVAILGKLPVKKGSIKKIYKFVK